MSKLKEFRIQQSLTQEELAESSGISIRTIQRIEKGLSTGSPHTIKNLARALEIENVDLFPEKSIPKTSSNTNTGKLKMMNLSILSCLLIPLGNVIFPSILFFVTKKNDEKINTEGRKILSSQILVTILLFLVMILTGVFKGQGLGPIPLPVIYGYWTTALVNLAVSAHTAISIHKEQEILKALPNLL